MGGGEVCEERVGEAEEVQDGGGVSALPAVEPALSSFDVELPVPRRFAPLHATQRHATFQQRLLSALNTRIRIHTEAAVTSGGQLQPAVRVSPTWP